MVQCFAGYGWLVTDCSENGRRSGSWSKRSEDEWFCLKCRMEPWRPGAILILKCESVELERGKRSDCVADVDAHSLGVE